MVNCSWVIEALCMIHTHRHHHHRGHWKSFRILFLSRIQLSSSWGMPVSRWQLILYLWGGPTHRIPARWRGPRGRKIDHLDKYSGQQQQQSNQYHMFMFSLFSPRNTSPSSSSSSPQILLIYSYMASESERERESRRPWNLAYTHTHTQCFYSLSFNEDALFRWERRGREIE